jgi:hypothetical protein
VSAAGNVTNDGPGLETASDAESPVTLDLDNVWAPIWHDGAIAAETVSSNVLPLTNFTSRIKARASRPGHH